MGVSILEAKTSERTVAIVQQRDISIVPMSVGMKRRLWTREILMSEKKQDLCLGCTE